MSVFLFGFVMLACATAPGTIGALLGKGSDGRLFVRGVPPGQGAELAGLQVDDEIVAIEGHAVKDLTPDEVRGAVRGNVGSTLTVTILRAGQKRDVKIERSPIRSAPPEKVTEKPSG